MEHNLWELEPHQRVKYVMGQVGKQLNVPTYMEKSEMSEATKRLFVEKNEAVLSRNKQNDRLWQFDKVARDGYYAFNFNYDDDAVRSQEDMIMFWGYTKYLAKATNLEGAMAKLSINDVIVTE